MWCCHLPSSLKITQHSPVFRPHLFQAMYVISSVHHSCHNSWESYCLMYKYETNRTVVLCVTRCIVVTGTHEVKQLFSVKLCNSVCPFL